MINELPVSRTDTPLFDTATATPINIAYFILVHRLPNQFKRLFKAIYEPDNCYLIHIDKKASDELKEEIRLFLQPFSHVNIMESENVVWGGYSMVQAELDGIKYLLEIDAEWDYFINLSGQDYPLKSQKIIRQFLNENKGKSYLKVANQLLTRPETMNRIENHFEELENSISKITHKRAFMKDVIPYIGGQWMMLTRTCCEFICNSAEVEKFEKYYFNTLIADESFFQTVLMNTSFDGVLVDDDKRAIIWIPDGDIKLRPKTFIQEDFDFLHLGDNLFARKFDDNVDNTIIDKMKPFYNIALGKTNVKVKAKLL
ncbi:beta-1,6-N-acetylglucosaminyltransferase [Sphingobacterium corticibacterium]|uniref:Peptide O-xylosyltransferase n=1 Tax=Sphingobacterium corticibacterium TaxID=2484746 RepID=A0A4Q6XKS0_9SPHI|nr:beta-1,6-N-acetylglucosaminyltransferase [Sphingobacterium corticibacterium]RZF57912.1 glycosyl transferase [Sphingobacterium corticibacterium]